MRSDTLRMGFKYGRSGVIISGGKGWNVELIKIGICGFELGLRKVYITYTAISYMDVRSGCTIQYGGLKN